MPFPVPTTRIPLSANVAYTRVEYDELLPRWDLIRDCIAGSDRIKEEGVKYLPKPNQNDASAENSARYEQYKDRAVFYNVTSRTLSGLVGQVFRKPPKIELPPVIQDMVDDVDGAGVSLWQQSRRTLSDTIAFSRGGLFVDYPDTGGEPVTRAQLATGMVRPTIVRYDPWDIINWRMRKVGGVYKLCLVVLAENYVVNDDGFEEETSEMWRVLKLDENNLYVVEEWVNLGDKKNPSYGIEKVYTPVNARGERFDYIPFQFVGAVNNDPEPDPPLLYDLAVLNIAHYRNSADYEESVYMVGQPTPYFSGLTEDWVKNVFKGKIELGSRSAVPLPVNGTAGLLQVSPNMLPKEAMDMKELQMVALGAKLLRESKVERREVEVIIRDFGEHANLTTVSKNVSEAYRAALGFALDFVSTSEEKIVFELNTDFEVARMNANELAQLIAMWQGRAITQGEMRDVLLRAGLAKYELDEYRTLLETEGPPDVFDLTAGADQNLLGQQG